MDHLVKGTSADDTLLVVGVVNTETVETARVLHGTYPTATAALGRVISGALLLGATLKDGQRVTLQVVGDGPLKGVLAESDWLCRVRGYVKRPHVHLDLNEKGKLDVGRAIGKGYLNVIKDLGLREPYRGTIDLRTGEIGEDIAYYLNISEQIPSAVAVGVYVETDNSVRASGGVMIQAMPDVKEDTIKYLEDRWSNIRNVTTMILDGAGPREMLSEAVGLPVKFLDKKDVTFYCPCSKERVLDALVTLGREEIGELIKKNEPAQAQCQFCGKKYEVTPEELKEMIRGA